MVPHNTPFGQKLYLVIQSNSLIASADVYMVSGKVSSMP